MEGYCRFLSDTRSIRIARHPWLATRLAGLAIFLIHRITLEITSDRRAAVGPWSLGSPPELLVANADLLLFDAGTLDGELAIRLACCLNPLPTVPSAPCVVGSLALVLHNPFPHTMFAVPWIVAIARSKEPGELFSR